MRRSQSAAVPSWLAHPIAAGALAGIAGGLNIRLHGAAHDAADDGYDRVPLRSSRTWLGRAPGVQCGHWRDLGPHSRHACSELGRGARVRSRVRVRVVDSRTAGGHADLAWDGTTVGAVAQYTERSQPRWSPCLQYRDRFGVPMDPHAVGRVPPAGGTPIGNRYDRRAGPRYVLKMRPPCSEA